MKAVVYHLHPAEGPVNLNSGHYVTYIRQAGSRHLANDSSVRPVLMSGLRGMPYLLVRERTDAPGEDVSPKEVQQPAEEIPVEIPSAGQRLHRHF